MSPGCNPIAKGKAPRPSLFPLFLSLWTRGTYLSEEIKSIELGMEQAISRNSSAVDLGQVIENRSPPRFGLIPGLSVAITPHQEFEVGKVLHDVHIRRVSVGDENDWMVANAVATVLRSPRGLNATTPSRATRTLSFATPMIVHHMSHLSNSGIMLVPVTFRYLLAVLVFFYFGFIHSYSGWVSTYSMILGVTSDSSQAATLTSVYYSW